MLKYFDLTKALMAGMFGTQKYLFIADGVP
jgi:hypothetical protein